MHSARGDEFSRLKLAQLWQIVNDTCRKTRNTYLHNRLVNGILKDDFNINCKVSPISIGDYYQRHKIHLNDCTALHFTYYNVYDIDTFNTLLERGADYTIKNGNGQTALHMMNIKHYYLFDIKNEMPFINSVLSAHVKFQNSANPHDDNGFSHLHAACIANHVEAVVLFLENGASVDAAVHLSEPQFAGYTPLHFAVEFHSFEVAQILLSRGANINAQTAKGKSPLDLLICNVRSSQVAICKEEQITKLLLEKGAISAAGLSSLHVACTLEDLTIAEQLLDQGADIDYTVPIKSSIAPGRTALYFAARNSIEAVKMLLLRGAKVEVERILGLTPLDICIKKYTLQNIFNILSSTQNWKDNRLTDGETKLSDLITAITNLDQFKLFLQNEIKDVTAVVSSDSILWPGYTILHLAVTMSKIISDDRRRGTQHEKIIVEECLNRGLNVNTQNARGQTPLHLAFSQCKYDIVWLLLEHLNRLDHLLDLVDEDNLSYLHIACAMKDESLAEKLLGSSKLNIAYSGKSIISNIVAPGSTPLHVVTANGSHTIADMLLRHGADLHAADKCGLTPIHWLILNDPRDDQRTANVLFGSLLTKLEDRVVDGLGLSYLHMACFSGNVEVVEKLLDLGSNVNAPINCNECSGNLTLNSAVRRLRFYSDYTPLQLAVEVRANEEVVKLLLRRGADVFVKGSNVWQVYSGYMPILNDTVLRCFFKVLQDQEDVQKCMEEKLGLTKLHIACYMKNEEAAKSALDDGLDVNAPVHADSVIFAGCTPLHLLMTFTDDYRRQMRTVESMIRVLLDHGADVTIANVEGDTPIHVACQLLTDSFSGSAWKDILLNAQQNFSFNPVNNEGLSHLHLACLWHNPDVVEKFLQHGSVDVNQPIDCFAKLYAGCTPLHLALDSTSILNTDWIKLSLIVDLLVEHGADVAAKDVHGDTPLHKPAVFRSPKMRILKILESRGGDMRSENIRGQTPIALLADTNKMDPSYCITVFEEYDLKINSWNRVTEEGQIAKIFVAYYNEGSLSKCSEFEKFTKSSDVRTVDNVGRTAIHNSVACYKILDPHCREKLKNYIYAIESFIKIGIDIEHQNKSGQTALHYAARMENTIGVEALLACGADVNAVDNSGKSAFSYAVEHFEKKNSLRDPSRRNVTLVLRLHIRKLQHLGIEVSQLNQSLLKRIQHFFDRPIDRFDDKHVSKSFFSQIEMTRTRNVGVGSLTLFDFLSETGAVNSYSLMSEPNRQVVDGFFKSINFMKLEELSGIMKLQLGKMKTRLGLIDSALYSLRTLLSFSVPELCEEISRFLSNSDLKSLISSTTCKTRE